MNLRTTTRAGRLSGRSHVASRSRRSPAALRRPAVFLAVAAAGALMVNVVSGGEPAARAGSASAEPVSVARELGLTASLSSPSADSVRRVQNLTASRSERGEGPGAAGLARDTTDPDTLRTLARAGQARAATVALEKSRAALALQRSRTILAAREQAVAQSRARAAAAAAQARQAAQAARAAQAAQAQAQPAAAPAPVAAAAPSSSYPAYALQKLGGDQGQFSCLESLWGRESGWNPNAANPSSSAYGIPQFLDSTWASTGIAKTSNGYRQIDAGLIYIDSRYGSPCGAWSHSESYGWY
jgi:hypothetical protein